MCERLGWKLEALSEIKKKSANCNTDSNLEVYNSARFVRLIFSLFLIGLRQAQVVNGIHGNRCIHGCIKNILLPSQTRWSTTRGTWCLVGVKGVLSLWCLSAMLLFGLFAGQRKRGLRVVVYYCNYRHVRRSSSILVNWTGKNDHGLNIVALVADY